MQMQIIQNQIKRLINNNSSSQLLAHLNLHMIVRSRAAASAAADDDEMYDDLCVYRSIDLLQFLAATPSACTCTSLLFISFIFPSISSMAAAAASPATSSSFFFSSSTLVVSPAAGEGFLGGGGGASRASTGRLRERRALDLQVGSATAETSAA